MNIIWLDQGKILWKISYPFYFIGKFVLCNIDIAEEDICMYRKIGIYVVAFLGVYLAFRFLLPLVVPFVIAGIVAILYYPFLRKVFQKWDVWDGGRTKRWLLAGAVIALYLVALTGMYWLLSYLLGQGRSMVLNYPFYEAKILCLMRKCCCRVDEWFQMTRGQSYGYVMHIVHTYVNRDMLQNVGTDAVAKVTSMSVQAAGVVFGMVFQMVIVVISTFFLILDYERIRENMLQSELGRSICRMVTTCKGTLKTYVKAQGLILVLDGLVCTVAFYIAGQPYFLVLGPLAAVVDALPVLGIGMILLPYALYLLLSGSVGKALIMVLAYVCCVVIRQITEPKMIGNQIGMRPIYTIMSMYVGFRLFGVVGFLLGPVGVLLVRQVVEVFNNTEGFA